MPMDYLKIDYQILIGAVLVAHFKVVVRTCLSTIMIKQASALPR